jgi:hypothetical protein
MDDSSPHNNPWRTKEDMGAREQMDAVRAAAMVIWNALPEGNRAWLEQSLVLPYENVIDIDEKGDDWFKGPHIYVVEFDPVRGPFREYRRVKLKTIDKWSSRQADADPRTRVEKFPRDK